MIRKLLKMYFDLIFHAPENIEKAMELEKKKRELIEKKYEEMKKKENL